jgi:hypothetical protein
LTVQFSSTNQAVSAKASDLVNSALLEIAVLAAGEAPEPQDAAWGLEKLQRIVDQFNARRELIFSIGLNQYTLIANHAPHTIGPGGDFNVPIRPVTVKSASFILNPGTDNPVRMPIKVRDSDWWAANPVQEQTSTIVTHLFYNPATGLGQLNFWPICTLAGVVDLETWNSLSQAVSLNSMLGFPQGYWDALVMELAVRLAPSFEMPVSSDLKEQWNRAMRVIQANNDKPPRIDTAAGTPSSSRGGRPDFNFLTGLRE